MRGYNIDNFIDKKFNHLTLIKNLNKIDKNNSKLALFQCDCGNIKELVFTQVLHGEIKSCGCEQGNLSTASKQKKDKSNIEFRINKTQKNNSSGANGISVINGKYRVRIQANKKLLHLGYFNNLEDAIKVRKEAEEKYFKPILDKYKGEN